MSEHSPERELAEIRRVNAEAAKFEAETHQVLRETEEAEARLEEVRATAAVAKNNALTSDWKFKREMASDKYHGVYRYVAQINEQSVKSCVDELSIWDRLDPYCDMEIIFNSPGGHAVEGFYLFDFLTQMREQGHFVTTHARGMAASMGGILLQAGDRRVMGREAYVLIHELQSGIAGKVSEIKDEAKFLELMGGRVLNIFADRSAQAFENGTSEVALTVDQFSNGDKELGISGWDRAEWWLDSDDCLRFGVVDEVK